MRRAQVAIGRKTISYLTSETGIPATRQHPLRNVVFLHAFPLQATMWEPNVGAVPHGWRAIAPDLRGFGESSLPQADHHRMSEYAGDVIDLLDRLEVTEAAFVGCSMGGYVLFEMLRAAPRYISAMALVSTRPGSDSEEGRKNREKMMALVEQEGIDAIADQMLPKLLGATTQRERPDVAKQVRNLIVANTRQGVKTAVKAMMNRVDSTPLLAHIAVPALIVAGAEDTLIPPTEADAMHKAIPTSQCELMPFAGHLPNLEQPGPFNALLWQFLQNS
ncbi:MAG TPA: alpha/beta fold hydrolase [Vicinamibacterales bacterium]|nr:alpha/beta fold hydrolase [Vicinamibacterales bacterium]